MRDLIVREPELKRFTLTKPLGNFPAGTILEGKLSYRFEPAQNNPTPLNKSTLLSDEAAEILGLNPDSATVNDAILKLAQEIFG